MVDVMDSLQVHRLLWGMIVLIFTPLIAHIEAKKIFCYYSSFSQTRQGIGKFLPEDIDPFLCTHIIYAFVDISSDGRDLRPFNRNDQGPRGLYSRTLALKEKNPELKVLLAVGGWQIGSKPFIPMISSESNRKAWVKNVVRYLRIHGFDGFDVDWEFPATRGSPADDKYRYTQLMKELYEAFRNEADESGDEKLILTMATASGTYYIDQSYEPKEIIKYLDYMLLMTYNYHGQWEPITGHHSGLHNHKDDPKSGEKSQLNTQWSIDYWLNTGMSPSKLVVGIATYGMSFTLKNAWNHNIHAPAAGGGKMGDYTRETGIMAYYEVCMNLRNKGWKSEWIDDQSVPYAYSHDQWVGYEDKDSVAIKAENIVSRGLAGAFVWSVEMDDFNDVCDAGDYPLLRTIKRILGGNSQFHAQARPAARHPVRTEARDTKINLNSLNKPKRKKSRRGKLRRKLRHRSSMRPRSTTDVPRTTTAPTTSTAMIPSTTADQNKLLVRWWSGSVWQKGATKKPWRRTTERQRTKKPLKIWRKKSRQQKRRFRSRKGKQTQRSNSVVSWETTPWWQSSSAGAKYSDKATVQWNARATGRPGLGLQKGTTPPPDVSSSPWSKVTTTPIEHSTGSTTPANSAGARSIDCRRLGAGTYADPSSCSGFIICMPGVWLDYPPHRMTCPAGTRFDAQMKICNYATHVQCN